MLDLTNNNGVSLNKKAISSTADTWAKPVIEGNMSPIEAYVTASFYKGILDEVMKKIKGHVIENIDKKTSLYGVDIEIVESGVKYAYEQDAKWSEINSRLLPILDELKAQEELIKIATKTGKSLVDEETGEVVASKVAVSSTTTPKVTFKSK